MASTTARLLWQRVALEIGRHQVAFVAPAAVGPDLGRWLLSPQTRSDGGAPVWEGAWVHMISGASADTRVIYEDTAIGGLLLDTVISVAAVVQGSEYDVLTPLPALTTNGVTGLLTLIQEACHEVWFEDRLDLIPAAGAYTVSLSTYRDWLDSEDRISHGRDGQPLLYDPAILTLPPHLVPDRYAGITFDGGTPTLRLRRAYLSSLASGNPAQLCVRRPAYSLVSGVESTAGPLTATDTISADPTEVVEVTKLRAYRYLAIAPHLSDQDRQRYAALIDPQEAWVRANVRHYAPRTEMPQQAAAGVAA